jgi:hypothetical protein
MSQLRWGVFGFFNLIQFLKCSIYQTNFNLLFFLTALIDPSRLLYPYLFDLRLLDWQSVNIIIIMILTHQFLG